VECGKGAVLGNAVYSAGIMSKARCPYWLPQGFARTSVCIIKQLLFEQMKRGVHEVASDWHEHQMWEVNVIVCHSVQLAFSCGGACEVHQ